MIPALADVGALCAFADGVEVEVARQLFERVEGVAHGGTGLQPVRLFRRFAWAQVDLNKHFGLQADGHLQSILDLAPGTGFTRQNSAQPFTNLGSAEIQEEDQRKQALDDVRQMV